MSFTLTRYGHATLGLETGGYRILVDPYFDENPLATRTADQVEADFILVTHGHNDHVGDTIAIARRTGALVISNSEIARWLENRGVKLLQPRHVIPIHFNTWPRIAQDAPAWVERVKAETPATVHLLVPGESFTL